MGGHRSDGHERGGQKERRFYEENRAKGGRSIHNLAEQIDGGGTDKASESGSYGLRCTPETHARSLAGLTSVIR